MIIKLDPNSTFPMLKRMIAKTGYGKTRQQVCNIVGVIHMMKEM